MAPAAAIDEPFLLSSYSVTQRSSKPSSKSKNQRQQASVFASYQKRSASSDGLVSVAAQSDGVHVVDVATLHPIISHTLGPSTSFACAPLTQHSSSKTIHTTFAVISSSTDLDPQHQGKAIWRWSDDLSGPLVERSSSASRSHHQVVVAPHLVAGLYDCEELPDRILVISPAGDISLLTTDLELKTTHPASQADNMVLSACAFSQTGCSFLGSRSEGAVIVLLLERGTSIQLEAYCVSTEDSITSTATYEVPLEETKVATASFSGSGILNIISFTGSWHTFSLTSSSLSPISSPLQLSNLSLTFPSSQKKASSLVTTPSLLALTSSHVLLASRTPQNEIALLLWDTQYSVLLASHLLPLPSSLTSQTLPIAVSLLSSGTTRIHAGNQQAVLGISQLTSEADGKTPIKSSIYIVPYSIPIRSTLANAMGYVNAGSRWLAGAESGGKSKNAAKAKIVTDMRAAIEQDRPQAANTLFMEWEEKERERLADGSVVLFDYTFVKDVLEAIFQPRKPPNSFYSSELTRHLIGKGVALSSMLDGGILASLRLRNDWPSIDLALRHVPDLSENELIETLNIITNHTPSQDVTTDPTTMQVDSTPSTLDQTPLLSTYLAVMLKYRQFTVPQLVVAFRHHLWSAEAVTSVIQLLDTWLKRVQSQEVKLIPSKKDITKNERGVFVVKTDMAKPRQVHDLPSANQILDFLQSLLDASFLTLIQYSPAHKVLKSLKANIEPEIAALSQTEQLRGLVEGFAKAQAMTIREAEAGKIASAGPGAGKNSKKDWRQRRREAHEQAGMAIGTYRLEELIL